MDRREQSSMAKIQMELVSVFGGKAKGGRRQSEATLGREAMLAWAV